MIVLLPDLLVSDDYGLQGFLLQTCITQLVYLYLIYVWLNSKGTKKAQFNRDKKE